MLPVARNQDPSMNLGQRPYEEVHGGNRKTRLTQMSFCLAISDREFLVGVYDFKPLYKFFNNP